ncbi:MAG: sialidase family protein [Blastocatellia bacterium]
MKKGTGNMLRMGLAATLAIAQVWAGAVALTGAIKSANSTGPTAWFELPVIPSPGSVDPRNETSIAVSPQNDQLIVGASKVILGGASGQGETRVAYYFSSNGGRDWGNGVLTLETAEKTWGRASDPSVAADLDGSFYICALMLDNSNGTFDSSVYIFKSTDGGRSFGTPVPVAVDVGHVSDPKLADKCYMAIDTSASSPLKGAMYVTWLSTEPTRSVILLSHKGPGETSFSAPATISHSGDMRGPSVTTGPNGELYAAWEGIGNPKVILFNASTDGGATFLPPVVAPSKDFKVYGFVGSLSSPNPAHLVSGVPRMNSFPVVDVDRSSGPNRGMIYITWAESRNGFDADVFVLKLTPPNGQKPQVGSPVRVNSDGGGSDQFFPWLSVDPTTGDVNVVFYDRRNDPANQLVNVYNARSTDGGASFSDNTRVSGASSNPQVQARVLGSSSAAIGIGDYIAATAARGKTHMMWTDTRNDKQEIFYGQLDFNMSGGAGGGGAVANDACSSPRAIFSFPFSEESDTRLATSATNDPSSCSGSPDSASVWYSFTSSSDTVLGIDTAGSDFNTVLSIYTGVCGGLGPVACSDDFGSSINPADRSMLAFGANAGVPYLIEVSGKAGGGNLRLRVGYPTITAVEYTPGPDGNDSLKITGAGFVNNNAIVTVDKKGVKTQLPTMFFAGAQPDGTATTLFGSKKKLKKLVKPRKPVVVMVESPAGSGRVSVPFSFIR